MKIFILEDNQVFFEELSKQISANLDAIMVPTNYDEMAIIIEKIRTNKEQFDLVIDTILNNDIAIIDLSLIGNEDYWGIEVAKALCNGNPNIKIYFTSFSAPEMIPSELPKYPFISKYNYSSNSDASLAIINEIKKDNISSKFIPKNSNPSANMNSWLGKFRLKIDEWIQCTFYLIIILCLAVLAIQLYQFIDHYWSETWESKLLFRFCEELFLWFLPLLIVLAFYNYYYKILRTYFLGGRFDSESQINLALKPITISKKILFSSLMAYTCLKIIDSWENDLINFENNLLKLVLLVILMTYIIISDRH